MDDRLPAASLAAPRPQERGDADRMDVGDSSGGIVARAIRSHQLWLTLGYFFILLLLARAYA